MSEKGYYFFIFSFISLHSYGACRFVRSSAPLEEITAGIKFEPVNTIDEQSINLSFVNSFNCILPWDKMYLNNNVGDVIYSIGGADGIKFKLAIDTSGFPINTPYSNNDYPSSVINKPRVIKFQYMPQDAKASVFLDGNSFSIKNAFTIESNECFRLGNSCVRGEASQYQVNLDISVIHKATTCKFESPATYEIQLEDISIQELLSGEKKRSQSTKINLNCDGIMGATSNPVSLVISGGDWDDGGELLRNNKIGARNVGFKLFSNSSNTALKKGSVLFSVGTYKKINSFYSFPISAEYVRTNNSLPTPGEVSSSVIFKVIYN